MKFSELYGDMSGTLYEGDIDISNKDLTSLEGMPESIIGSLDCSKNDLTSLEGIPIVIASDFDCSDNPNEHLFVEYLFRLNNPYIPEHIFKIKMYLQTKSEYYLTLEEYEEYIEKYPEHFI